MFAPPSVRSPKCHPNKLLFFCFKVTFCSGFSGPITTSALCLGFNTTQSRTQNKPVEHCRDLRKPCWPVAVNLSFIVFNQIHQLFSSTSVTAAKSQWWQSGSDCAVQQLTRWSLTKPSQCLQTCSLKDCWCDPFMRLHSIYSGVPQQAHMWGWYMGEWTCVSSETLPCCQTWICYGAWQILKHWQNDTFVFFKKIFLEDMYTN